MNAKKLLSTLLSAAMAVSMLAGCFGGGGNKNYSDEAADAANAAQSTVVFATDTTLAKSLQDALADGLTQLDEIDDAMEADENLKPLLTSGWDLDIFAAQGEDAEAAAKTIAEQYIVSAVIGKKAEGKIAMVLHDGNGYYYVAVLTYGNGGSGSGGGAGGGSGSGEGGQGGGTTPGTDPDEPGPDDDENNPGGGDDDVIYYSVTTNAQGGNGHYNTPSRVEKGQELSFTVTANGGYEAVVTATMGGEPIVLIVNGNRYTYGPVTDDIVIDITFAEKAPTQYIVHVSQDGNGGTVRWLGDNLVTAGDSFELLVRVDDGYEALVSAVDADGMPVKVIDHDHGNYTINEVNSDIEVTVTFVEKVPTQYIVHVSQDGNGGTVRWLGDNLVTAGDSFELLVRVDDGYEALVSAVDADGMPVKVIDHDHGNYTINEVNSDIEVTVTFVEKVPSQYMVNVSVNDTNGGTVSADIDGDGKKEDFLGDTFVTAGEDFTFTVTPNEGFEVDKVTVNGDEVNPDDNGKYVVKNVQNDLTVSVTFKRLTYTVKVVTKGGDANCTVTPMEGTVSVENPNFEFTVTVSEDYSAQPVVTSGSAYVVAGHDGKSYTVVTDVTGDVTVTVNFVKKQPVVTALYADPDTITRYVGQTFKKDDLKIYAVYSNDSANPVLVDIDDCKVTGAPNDGELTAEGTYTVKVTFGNQTTEVTVIVKKPYVTGIKVTTTGTGNILREYRAFPSPSDTVFKVYKYEKTGSVFGIPVFEWVEEYRDDITITIEYMGQDSLVIDTPTELEKYVEAGQLTAEEFTSPGLGLYNTQTVTISYKDNTMTKAVDTEIDVTVTWIKPNT